MLTKIYSIELLRFFAALSVALFHIAGFKYGYVGVDVFFVISGFVIMYSTENNSSFFFIKRLIRIIPLYWSITIVWAFLLIVSPNSFEASFFDYMYFLKSIFFIPFSNDGLAPGIGHSPYIFLGWSLNYEMLFYLTFQISIFFSKKMRGIISIILILLIHFILISINTDSYILLTYSSIIFLEFALGIFIYYIWIYFKNLNYSNNQIFFTSLILISLLLLFSFNQVGEYSRFNREGIFGAFVVVVFVFLFNNIQYSKIFLILGSISYPMYLIHPYTHIVLERIYNYYGIIIPKSITIFISLITIFIISYCTHYYYEKKIITFLKKILI